MPDVMKCPFREVNGEYCDCYGKNCMAYYEMPTIVCTTEDSKNMPMCRKIMSQYPAYNQQMAYVPYRHF